MKNIKVKYLESDISIVIPTKDRPKKIYNLLESISKQNFLCGRIIIVDGGKSIKKIIDKFKNKLNIEYYITKKPGQIRQRNFGLSKLDVNTKLVALFDDDIVLTRFALKNMLSFWNNTDSNTAAVSFNIINEKSEKHTFIKGLMGLTGPYQGKILSSGRNTSILSIKKDIRSQWVSGGATVWKFNILKNNYYPEKNVRWAILEDVIYSYPIGKIYPLYVSANSKVKHEHEYDLEMNRKYEYYGKSETLWRFYFVNKHKELSKYKYFWTQFSTIFARVILGIIFFKKKHLDFAMGQIIGLKKIFIAKIKNKDFNLLMKDSNFIN